MSKLLQLNYQANLFYKLIEWIVSTLSLDIKGILYSEQEVISLRTSFSEMDTSDDENEKLKTKDITTFGSLIKQKLDLDSENGPSKITKESKILAKTPAEKLLFICTIAENVFKKLEYKSGKFELREDLEMKEEENELKIFPCWSYEDEQFCLETIEIIKKLLKIYENIKELYGLEYSGEKYKKMLIEIKKEMDLEEILPSDLEIDQLSIFSPTHFASTNLSESRSETLFNWLNFQNDSNYTPIAPASPELLIKLGPSERVVNGLSLSQTVGSTIISDNKVDTTTENSKTNSNRMTIKGGRRMRKHHRQRVDANTPFTLRAICPFKFVLNHKPDRIPSTLIEVECLSHSPSQILLGRPLPLIECEPMRWTIRVLECNNDKKQEGKEINCLPVEEHIPLACVPVLQANKESREPIRSEDDLTDIVAKVLRFQENQKQQQTKLQ
uniref:Uncharacterized protein n=1 Tax=Meloidogyne floridensis TaxID=298350 RepID=A0A915P9I4_9BILA